MRDALITAAKETTSRSEVELKNASTFMLKEHLPQCTPFFFSGKFFYYHRSVNFFVGPKILTPIDHECPKQGNTFFDTDTYQFVFFEITD